MTQIIITLIEALNNENVSEMCSKETHLKIKFRHSLNINLASKDENPAYNVFNNFHITRKLEQLKFLALCVILYQLARPCLMALKKFLRIYEQKLLTFTLELQHICSLCLCYTET